MAPTSTKNPSTLLLCTVGGSPDPLLKSIEHWAPARVVLLHSPQTKDDARTIVEASTVLNQGNVKYHLVNDAQDLVRCVADMRPLGSEVQDWHQRGPSFRVVVDPTGGTKCMTAALALVSRRWPCTYSYIGGDMRTKDGVGVVVHGNERALETANPLDALGYQAIEDACLLFDRHAYRAAAQLLDDARKQASRDEVKRSLSTFHDLCKAYNDWDRFQHKDAIAGLRAVEKNCNDFHAALDRPQADALRRQVTEHRKHLDTIIEDAPNRALVLDLLANASRRAAEGRYDDAVARLYRSIEACAQMQLREKYKLDSANVPLKSIPAQLREVWATRAAEHGGMLQLSLQHAYELLWQLEDPLGIRFRDAHLHEHHKSPLINRNKSILAHGFDPVKDKTFKALWEKARELCAVQEDELPCFPILGVENAT